MTQTLVQRLKSTVKRFPDREAVVLNDRRLTYAELREQAGAVASFLLEQGLKPGDRAALFMNNSPEYVAAYYGVLAAGGAAIGLNTASKARDIVNWLKHSEASWLFADGRLRELPEIIASVGDSLSVVTVGESARGGPAPQFTWNDVLEHKQPGGELTDKSQPDALAAIIYTSGTTGSPKGVMLSHHNLLSNTKSILDYLELTCDDVIVNVLPFYYSYGNSVLHTHLAVGGRLVLENSFVYPHRVLERMVAEKATGFSGVPSTFALLLSRTNPADFDLRSLRYMTQAGGPMPPANQKRLVEALPHIRFFIMYGQTEASARLSYLPPEKFIEKNGSIGIPIPGVELDIRDPDGTSLPPGRTGEIWARGPNVMMGYWKSPEMTGKVLCDGWLKTGDMARFDEDRYIYIIGRNSEMIKVGANRISPKEIEEVVTEIDGIEEVAAVGVDDEILGQVVKLVIVCKKGCEIEKQAIQRYCRKNLAQYKIPRSIEFAHNLPKTASGKIRRHLL